MRTYSPTPFSPKRPPEAPWTNISLSLAVSWMLLLAFGPKAPSSREVSELGHSQLNGTVEVGLMAGMYIAAHHVLDKNSRWQAGALVQVLDPDD